MSNKGAMGDRGSQNAITLPIFVKIKILTLPELVLKGNYSFLQFKLFLTISMDSEARCVF